MIARIGQAAHMGKWESHAAIVRVVRDLVHKLEDGEDITKDEISQVDNVIYEFLSRLPKKVYDEVLHG